MPCGIIVSETEPGKINRYYWFNPKTRKWYELDQTAENWVETFDEPNELGDMTFTGDVHFKEEIYASEGENHKGKNEKITISGIGELTFKKGLLVDFEPE